MTDTSTERRTAFVTGAARGLGAAIARALHSRNGCNVVVTDIDAEGAAAVAVELDATGATAWAAPLDVRSRSDFASVFDAAVARFGRVDVLVNNAGVTTVRPFFEVDDAEWDDVLAVNLKSVLYGSQIAGRHMSDNGWGRIINLTSVAGQIGSRIAGAHYSVSKAGIIVLTKVAAGELAAAGVTVNAVSPAVVRTPVMAELPQDRLEQLIQTIPVGRVGEADEIGALVAFLASEDAGYITGATLDINGGGLMR
jgi:3-oxoacyl-[acyl-carrier protein] reductase